MDLEPLGAAFASRLTRNAFGKAAKASREATWHKLQNLRGGARFGAQTPRGGRRRDPFHGLGQKDA